MTEEKAEKRTEREKKLRERELNDIGKILEIPEGRRLLWRIMDVAETFGFANTDKRIIGIMLFHDIMDTKPKMFLQMSREHKSEQESIAREYAPDEEEI